MRERNVCFFWPFPCSGFPMFHGGVLDHSEPSTERLRIFWSRDGGSDPADDYVEERQSARFADFRSGRLVASS